ncbi:unnamed protein product [Camellia sinensis]
MDHSYAYCCWEDEKILATPSCGPIDDGIYVQLQFSNELKKSTRGSDSIGKNHDSDVILLDSYRWVFFFSRNDFLESENMKVFLFGHLRCRNLPSSIEESIINEVRKFARVMVNLYPKPKVLPIVLDVVVRTFQRPDLSVEEAVARIMRDIMREPNHFISLPTTKSSIEALKKRTPKDSCLVQPCAIASQKKTCALCSKTLPIRINVTTLPCSHKYHDKCIVKRFKISQTCPVCRMAF